MSETDTPKADDAVSAVDVADDIETDEGSASDESGVESDRASDTQDAPEDSTIGTERSARKVRDGVVTSAGMDKTIVVTITERVRHARYNKFILQSKKLYTHDETNDAGVGDKVRIMECRPLSKSKRWRLVEITERAR